MCFSQWTFRNYNEHAKQEQPDLDAHGSILVTSYIWHSTDVRAE